MTQETTRLTLRDYIAPIRARWVLVVALVVVTTAVVYVIESNRTKTYTASTKVFLGQQNVLANEPASLSTSQGVADQAVLLTSNEVAAVVAKNLRYTGSPAALGASVTATPATTTNFITITATEHTSEFAARVANAFAQEFIARNTATARASFSSQLATLEQQLATLKGAQNAAQRATVSGQIQQLQLQENNAVQGGATQIDIATPPPASSGHSPKLYAGLAAVAALLGSILLAYLLHRLDPKIQTIDEASDIYAHPILATVAHDGDIDFFDDGMPGLSERSRESFRELRMGLDVAARGQRFSRILITSASEAEGKSTVARNLAIALAEAGRRTALIDADLRKSSLAKRLGVDHGPGVTEVIAGASSLEDVQHQIEISELVVPGLEQMAARLGQGSNGHGPPAAKLTLIQAGVTPPNPAAVLESDLFLELLEKVSNDHDVVVIDSTPVTAVSDALPVMPHVNAIVLVARNDRTDRRAANRAAELIGRVAGASIVGVVVNDVPAGEAAAYGMGYGYSYRRSG